MTNETTGKTDGFEDGGLVTDGVFVWDGQDDDGDDDPEFYQSDPGAWSNLCDACAAGDHHLCMRSRHCDCDCDPDQFIVDEALWQDKGPNA